MASLSEQAPLLPGTISARFNAWLCGMLGYVVLAACGACALSLLSWQIADPSLTHAASGPVSNLLGPVGAIISDLIMQLLGLAGVFVFLPPVFWALQLIGKGRLDNTRAKLMLAPIAVLLLACAASSLPRMGGWPLPYNVGGLLGDLLLRAVTSVLAMIRPERASAAAGLFCFAGGLMLLMTSLGLSQRDLKLICQRPRGLDLRFVCPGVAAAGRNVGARDHQPARAHAGDAGAVLARGACLRRASTCVHPCTPRLSAGPSVRTGAGERTQNVRQRC